MIGTKRLKVISIGLDPTIALGNPSAGSRGDSMRRQQEYAGFADGYTAIVKTPRSPRYRPHRWGSSHSVLPTLSTSPFTFPLDAYRLAARSLNDTGADLVVTQDPFATGLAGYWLKRRFGLPLCIQVHNDMIGCEWWLRESRPNRLMEPLGQWLLRRADTVQVVSNTIRARLAARGVDPRRMWNIMTGAGIDSEQFRSADGSQVRARLLDSLPPRGDSSELGTECPSSLSPWSSAPSPASVVLFMGRLVKQKDLPTLLRAASLVVAQQPDALFVLVGDGEDGPLLEGLRRELGLEINLLLLQGIGPEEAPAYVAACDLFVMSSLYEGKARALVEAACAGKPIVSTAVSGADEVVEEGRTGFLVPLRDPRALADRILRVLRDPQLAREMGRRGQQLACERYDRARNVEQMVRMWEATARGED